jgi:16S rRNA (uracil1498-N3)-methyltransferase
VQIKPMSDRPTPAQKLNQIQQELGQRLQRLTLRSTQSPLFEINLAQEQLVNLNHDQHHYLARVLRLAQGDKFVAIDRYGRWWLAQIERGQGEQIAARLIELLLTDVASRIEITLAVAMPKGNSFEAIVKPVVELGVDRIVPLYSDRTVFQPHRPIGQQKQLRWQRIAQEATEQSLQTRITEIATPQSFKDFVNKASDRHKPNSYKYICVTDTATHLLSEWQKEWRSLDQALSQSLGQALALSDQNPRPQLNSQTQQVESKQSANPDRAQLIILTGPEGGWTEAEAAIAKSQGFQPISLGSQILTATTAPVVALAIVNGVIQADDHA